MKGFKLSKNSWHYKLYSSNNWNDPTNFCDYFWTVVREICKYVLLFAILLFIIFIIGVATYKNPFFVMFIGFVLMLIFSVSAKVEEYKENKRARAALNEEKGPGFFKLKYMSIKNKYCPKIEWID